ncbi:GNAT family N-acetyltransferase [Adhaeribacter radiodurans]|uniref:GNAT family N-acetyltransferase n=1 Tax=Adhaeribacter radiodurans TaxID=2745197 RepID=A0A7L7LEH4_9BACT|nr:GNAT family N-acetyltransferase [Adhaeribacter radiodurans]QMU30915.1 GNAT family N-acetyltransferase [Adhaeribacter radiodurans]
MNTSQFPEIKTDRLLLRKLKYSDWKEISFLRSDETVNQYVDRPSAESQEEANNFIKRINENVDLHRSFYWCISQLGNNEMIGSICLWNISEDRKTAEVGYDLHPHFQGCGIMSEALISILHYGFNNLNLEKIEAFTHRNNESSRRLLLKNNFVLVEYRNDDDNENNVIYVIENKQAKR